MLQQCPLLTFEVPRICNGAYLRCCCWQAMSAFAINHSTIGRGVGERVSLEHHRMRLRASSRLQVLHTQGPTWRPHACAQLRLVAVKKCGFAATCAALRLARACAVAVVSPYLRDVCRNPLFRSTYIMYCNFGEALRKAPVVNHEVLVKSALERFTGFESLPAYASHNAVEVTVDTRECVTQRGA